MGQKSRLITRLHWTGESRTVRLRLSDQPVGTLKRRSVSFSGKRLNPSSRAAPGSRRVLCNRHSPPRLSPDATSVMRQALAGMLWSKQFFNYDVGRWLKDHGIQPYKTSQRSIRNDRWGHMFNADVISMPDKWNIPGTPPGISPSMSRL